MAHAEVFDAVTGESVSECAATVVFELIEPSVELSSVFTPKPFALSVGQVGQVNIDRHRVSMTDHAVLGESGTMPS